MEVVDKKKKKVKMPNWEELVRRAAFKNPIVPAPGRAILMDVEMTSETSSGIVIPSSLPVDQRKEVSKQPLAFVLAVGEAIANVPLPRFKFDKTKRLTSGDLVLHAPQAGYEISLQGSLYRVVHMSDIEGLIYLGVDGAHTFNLPDNLFTDEEMEVYREAEKKRVIEEAKTKK